MPIGTYRQRRPGAGASGRSLVDSQVSRVPRAPPGGRSRSQSCQLRRSCRSHGPRGRPATSSRRSPVAAAPPGCRKYPGTVKRGSWAFTSRQIHLTTDASHSSRSTLPLDPTTPTRLSLGKFIPLPSCPRQSMTTNTNTEIQNKSRILYATHVQIYMSVSSFHPRWTSGQYYFNSLMIFRLYSLLIIQHLRGKCPARAFQNVRSKTSSSM
jgi:hypothetical protein